MKNLFVDFDITIVDSVKVICKLYNQDYCNDPSFNIAIPENLYQWNMKDECPLCNNLIDYFDSSRFFDILEFQPNAYEVLEELNKKYNLIIVTSGTLQNLHLKSKWIEENIPFINDVILIKSKDKSLINMKNSIFIDDLASNLETSNAEMRIVFGKIKGWNEDWKGMRCENWLEIKEVLL